MYKSTTRGGARDLVAIGATPVRDTIMTYKRTHTHTHIHIHTHTYTHKYTERERRRENPKKQLN